MVLVFDGNGNVTNRSLHGPAIDQLFADESAVDGLLWALSDRQGSVRDWAKYDAATGTTSVYNHVEFDAWGRIESQSNAGHRVTTGHAGRYHDPLTGLVWHRGRWRDPKATWLGSDPIGLAGGDPNLYRFVGNSPTNGTDPSGLEVFVASRDFASPLGNHHFIIVVPKNPNDFRGLVSLGGGKRGFTVAGFDTEGRLRPQFNNTDDIAAAMEALGTRRKGRVWDYDCETKRVPRPKGMTDTQFISEILSKVKNYRRNENADPIDYDLGDRNCASWVNALLQELGYPEPTRDDLLEFDGIDWGEEDPLTPNPFMDPVPRRR